MITAHAEVHALLAEQRALLAEQRALVAEQRALVAGLRVHRHDAVAVEDAQAAAILALDDEFRGDTFGAALALERADDAASGPALQHALRALCGAAPTASTLGRRLSAALRAGAVGERGEGRLRLRAESALAGAARWSVELVESEG